MNRALFGVIWAAALAAGLMAGPLALAQEAPPSSPMVVVTGRKPPAKREVDRSATNRSLTKLSQMSREIARTSTDAKP